MKNPFSLLCVDIAFCESFTCKCYCLRPQVFDKKALATYGNVTEWLLVSWLLALMSWLLSIMELTFLWSSHNAIKVGEKSDSNPFTREIKQASLRGKGYLWRMWSAMEQARLHEWPVLPEPVLVCLFFVALHPKSTAMVMAGRSVHLTTLFLGKLEQAVYQYFVHILSLVTDNNPSWMLQLKGGEWP